MRFFCWKGIRMNEIRFASKEHEDFFFSMLKRNRTTDNCYHAFAYCVGISEMTRDNIHRIFDFDRKCIKPEGLHEGWQTGGSVRLTRLAFNLWNGYAEKGKERMSTPYELFDCGYAPYFFEAIRLKYPEYCRSIPALSPKIAQMER